MKGEHTRAFISTVKKTEENKIGLVDILNNEDNEDSQTMFLDGGMDIEGMLASAQFAQV